MDCEEECGEIGTHSYYGSDAGNQQELTVLKHRCRVGWRETREGWREEWEVMGRGIEANVRAE